MSLILTLFAVGLVLLAFEAVLPGAILGIFGSLALLGGCVVAFLHYGASGGAIAVVSALVLAGLLLYVEFRVLPRTRLGRRLFLQSQIGGENPAVAPATVVGQAAQAVTVLAPSGYVLVNGRKYEAYSNSGYIAAGTPLRVVALDNFRLIVTQA